MSIMLFRQRERAFTRCLLAVLLIVSVHAAVHAADDDVPAGLTLTIKPEKLELKEDGPIVVSWELENRGSSPVYICQWPGVAFGFGWDMGDGKTKGVEPGYPDSKALERKYFIELKPGEAVFGWSTVTLFGTDAGEVWLKGEYRSDQTGAEYGLKAWRGRVYSEGVRVKVPKVSTEHE